MKNLILFEEKQIRRVWNEQDQKWYFSIVDVCDVLLSTDNPRRYWSDLKRKLTKEGSGQLYEKIVQLKLLSADGKKYATDCADVETMLRIVQSVPSKKAEPIKQWLAKVGYERMQEMADPAQAIDRARKTWKNHGRSEKWIQQRMMGQETRNKLTDYWKDHDIKEGKEYAILSNILHQEWSELSVKDHKELKGLKSQNLRDHMSEAELIFTALAELSTRQIAEADEATGLDENKTAAKKGGNIAKQARKQLEEKTGQSVISDGNFLPPDKNPKKITKKEGDNA